MVGCEVMDFMRTLDGHCLICQACVRGGVVLGTSIRDDICSQVQLRSAAVEKYTCTMYNPTKISHVVQHTALTLCTYVYMMYKHAFHTYILLGTHTTKNNRESTRGRGPDVISTPSLTIDSGRS